MAKVLEVCRVQLFYVLTSGLFSFFTLFFDELGFVFWNTLTCKFFLVNFDMIYHLVQLQIRTTFAVWMIFMRFLLWSRNFWVFLNGSCRNCSCTCINLLKVKNFSSIYIKNQKNWLTLIRLLTDLWGLISRGCSTMLVVCG